AIDLAPTPTLYRHSQRCYRSSSCRARRPTCTFRSRADGRRDSLYEISKHPQLQTELCGTLPDRRGILARECACAIRGDRDLISTQRKHLQGSGTSCICHLSSRASESDRWFVRTDAKRQWLFHPLAARKSRRPLEA